MITAKIYVIYVRKPGASAVGSQRAAPGAPTAAGGPAERAPAPPAPGSSAGPAPAAPSSGSAPAHEHNGGDNVLSARLRDAPTHSPLTLQASSRCRSRSTREAW